MTLQQLLYVLTVSDEKTMNKAAEKLFVSQPTLTSAIQSLEKELNIPFKKNEDIEYIYFQFKNIIKTFSFFLHFNL